MIGPRPRIPVRDGLRLPTLSRRQRTLTEVGAHDYRAGFWLGYIAGLCWGAILVAIVCGVAWPKKSPYEPIYEKGTSLLVGWCGGPVPKEIPQQSDEVDIGWKPVCDK